MLVYAPERGHHAHSELLGGHFHAEYDDRNLFLDRRVFRDIHGEAGLAHGGPSRDDDEIGVLQSRRQLVYVGEAGGRADKRAALLREGVYAIHHAHQQVLDRAVAAPAARAAFGDVEYQAFRLFEQFGAVAPFRLVRLAGNVGADANELAQDGALTHYRGVGLDVRRAGGVFGERGEIRQPARIIQFLMVVEPLGKGYHIIRLRARGEAGDGAKDQAMIAPVKIVFAHQVRDVVPGEIVEHEATQHRLLGLDGVRRRLELRGFRIKVSRKRINQILHASPFQSGAPGGAPFAQRRRATSSPSR